MTQLNRRNLVYAGILAFVLSPIAFGKKDKTNRLLNSDSVSEVFDGGSYIEVFFRDLHGRGFSKFISTSKNWHNRDDYMAICQEHGAKLSLTQSEDVFVLKIVLQDKVKFHDFILAYNKSSVASARKRIESGIIAKTIYHI